MQKQITPEGINGCMLTAVQRPSFRFLPLDMAYFPTFASALFVIL